MMQLTRMTFRLATLSLTALLASGCNVLPSVETPDLYNLTPKSTFDEDVPQVQWQLVIEELIAAGGLDTARIATRSSPTEINYFANARWTERAPKMVQSLLVESFENSHRIVSVGRQAVGLRSDFNLKAELREFQAEYFDGAATPTVRVTINAKLVTQPRQEIVASKTFESRVEAREDSMAAIVEAFDDALGRVMKHIVQWTLELGKQHYKARG